jgi:hypothetical protein
LVIAPSFGGRTVVVARVRQPRLCSHSFRFLPESAVRSSQTVKTSLAKSANRPLASQIERQIKALGRQSRAAANAVAPSVKLRSVRRCAVAQLTVTHSPYH